MDNIHCIITNFYKLTSIPTELQNNLLNRKTKKCLHPHPPVLLYNLQRNTAIPSYSIVMSSHRDESYTHSWNNRVRAL